MNLKKYLISTLVAMMALVTSTQAQAYDLEAQLSKRFDQAEKSFRVQATRCQQKIVVKLKQELARAKKQGKHDAAEELANQLFRFQDSRAIPVVIDSLKYRQLMTRLLERCVDSQNQSISLATKKADVELARQLADRRDEFVAWFEEYYPDTMIRRVEWKHANGRFKKSQNKTWYEYTPNTRYAFIEVRRDASCVYLYDQSRNVRVILGERNCRVIGRKGRGRTPYQGSWAD